MKLHTAGAQADWAQVNPARRNHWQQWAAATGGWITPGNVLSVVGFVLVCVGLLFVLRGQLATGLVFAGLGRLADIADGWAAHKTGTKSALGEALDASIDKACVVLTVVVCGVAGLVSWWVLGVLAILNVVLAGVALVARARHNSLHPSAAGKLFTAGMWVVLGLFVLAALLDARLARVCEAVAYTLLVPVVVLGLRALVVYYRAVFRGRNVVKST